MQRADPIRHEAYGFPWAWVAAVLLVHLWLWPYWPLLRAPDDHSRLYLTRALVEQHRLDVDAQVARFGPLQVLASFEGRSYSDKALGHPLLAALAYLPIHALLGDRASQPLLLHLLSLLTVALPTALVTAALCRELQDRLGAAAHLVAASYAFGSPALPYASLYYGHQPAAALCFLAWLLIVRRKMGWAGLCLGMSVITEFPVAALAGGLGLWALARADDHHSRLRACLGALLPAFLQAAYNFAIFGDPLELAYSHKTDPAGTAIHAAGLWGITLLPRPEAIWGLLFGTSKGLLFYAPVAGLAMLGPLLGREPRTEGRGAILGGAAALLLLLASFTSWPGGWSTGPRMLLPALPLIYLLIGEWGRRVPVPMLGLLCGIGMLHCGLPVLTTPLLPPEAADPVAEIAANLAHMGAWTFTLGGFWMPQWAGAVLLVGMLGAAVLLLAGPRQALSAAAGVVLAALLTELRRPEPVQRPDVAVILASELYFAGLPERGAALAEAVQRAFDLPPKMSRSIREEILRSRQGRPPPLSPILLEAESDGQRRRAARAAASDVSGPPPEKSQR